MRNVNRKLLNNKGFTLAEMLLTVSIIIILGALVAVNVIRYQRKLKLTEMDNAAREIYMAAQNHLSDSVSTGDWGEIYDKYGKTKADDGSAVPSKETKTNYLGTYIGDKIKDVDQFADDSSSSTETSSTNDKKHEFYYLIVNSKNDLTGNAMAQLLPMGAIDETVRKGAYIIEYDAIQGQVYDVFYTDGDVKLTYKYTVTALDDKIKQNSGSNKNRTDSKNLRERFSVSLSSGSKKVALGYYGGASLNDDAFQKNQKVTVEVKNENRLYLIVTVPGSITQKYMIDQKKGIEITLKDLRSDASKVKGVLNTKKGPVTTVTTSKPSQTQYIYILDSPVEKGYSITDASHIDWQGSDSSSFSPSSGNTNEKFHAGDNLRASVTITAKKSSSLNKTKKFKATSEKFNSTYAEGSSDTSARITNARHLQNLAISTGQSAPSGSNQTASSNSTTVVSLNTNPKVSNQISDVKILSDIIWHKEDQPASSQTTDDQAAGQQNADGNKGNQTDATEPEDYFEKLKDEAKEYGFDSSATTVVTTNFTGIQSSTISNVSGSVESTDASKQNQAPVLSDFMISDPTGYYGLFAKMGANTSSNGETYSLSLTNLSLKNFYLTNVSPDGQDQAKIDTTTQNRNKKQPPIGAGSLIGQFDGKSLNVNKVSIENVTENFESNQGIKAGGLIGAITNSSKANITDCYASVSGIAGNNTAVKDPNNTIISNTNLGGLIGSIDHGAHVLRCYSSGRTVNGGDYDEKHPNISVQNGNVGGLIGNAKGSTFVTYSYSTCSVGANKQNGKTNGSCGGFIGFISRTSSVEGCYSTGLIINLAEETSTDTNNKWADYGQFIGETNSKGSPVKVSNCSVLKGINNDQISTIWDDEEQNTNNYDIKIQSSLGQVAPGEKNPFVVSEKSRKTAAPVDGSLDKKYHYCTTRQLSNLFQPGTVDDSNDIGHVGDWPIENEQATVGLIYYEYIKKDDEKKLYYSGFWENMSKDPNQYHVQPLTKLEGDKFPTDGYVVEDGYALVLKVDDKRKNTIKAPNGTKLSDTKTFIGTDKTDGTEYDSLSLSQSTVNDDGSKIGLDKDDYKLYRIKEPDEDTQSQSLYKMIDQTKQLNVYVQNSDKKTKTKYASFYVNLYSANAVFASKDKLPDSLTIRSARQFYNLFYESVNNKNFGLLTSNHTIYQEMDIDFQQKFTNKFLIQDDNNKEDSNNYQSKFQKLDTTKMTFVCKYYGKGHSLINWTRTDKDGKVQNLFGNECTGTLENLNFYNVTGLYLFNTCKANGSIKYLTFYDCNMKSPLQSGKVDPSVKSLNSQAKSAFPFGQDSDDTSDKNRDHALNTTSTPSSNQTTGQTLNQDDSYSNQAAGNVSNKGSNN